jgi:hypothetical protein
MKKAISQFLVFAFLLWQWNVLHIHDHQDHEQDQSEHHSHFIEESFRSETCSDHQDAPQSHQHISEDCTVCDLNNQSPAEWIQPKFSGHIIHFCTKINPYYFQSVDSVLPDNSHNKSPPHLG